MIAVFQFLSALFVGVCYYMLAMAMTVYDGFLSLIFQPIMAVVFTTLGIGLVWIAGLPIRFSKRLRSWWLEHWWISFVIGTLAFAMMCASWHPDLRVQVWNPDLEDYQASFQPHLGFGGWLLALFAVLHFHPPFKWLLKTARAKS